MNIIYFVPNITIAGGIFRIVSDKMNYLAENMEGRLFLAYYGNGQEKPIYPLHPNIQQCSFIDMDITIYLSADKEDP